MKHQIKTSLVASLISATMCLALGGCSRHPAGDSAASNTSAANANSGEQSASTAAASQEQPPAPSSEAPATDASKSDPLASPEARKSDPLANPEARKSDPLANAEARKPDSLASAAPQGERSPQQQPPPPPRTYTISAGRPISIYTTSTLSTKTNRAGDSFVGTLTSAIMDKDWVIAKKGATVEGLVTSSDPGGKVKGVASLTVVVKRLQLADGRKVDLSTSSFTKQAKTTMKKDAIKIGGGAVAGAVIGAIIGGKKGAAIGAGVGGGAGTGAVLATRGDPATIPAETPLTFRLRAPVKVVKR